MSPTSLRLRAGAASLAVAALAGGAIGLATGRAGGTGWPSSQNSQPTSRNTGTWIVLPCWLSKLRLSISTSGTLPPRLAPSIHANELADFRDRALASCLEGDDLAIG